MLAISGFWLWALKIGAPLLLGSILTAVPLTMCIKALRNLLGTIIAANEDGKITTEEFNDICNDAKKLKSRLVVLLKSFIKSFIKNGK